MAEEDDTVHYDGATGGWGSMRGMSRLLAKRRGRLGGEHAYRRDGLKEVDRPDALRTLQRQNKPGGFMCVSCAWTKPAHPHAFEFCENGAKATLWDLHAPLHPEVLAKHSLTELKTWRDHDLEQLGRLTHPMRYDSVSDAAAQPQGPMG